MTAPPRRRVRLVVEVEGDTADDALFALERLVDRIGYAQGCDDGDQPHDVVGSGGRWVQTIDPDAPTGDAYDEALRVWAAERRNHPKETP